MYIIVKFVLIDNEYIYYGPFFNEEEAKKWADEQLFHDNSWGVVKLRYVSVGNNESRSMEAIKRDIMYNIIHNFPDKQGTKEDK